MTANKQRRFIVVTRKTRLQELVERFNSWPQAKFYLEHNDIDAADYLAEHDTYKACLMEIERFLKPLARYQLLERSLLPSYQFNPDDIIVTLGQDGLVANTLKYLDGQPLVAINPDPKRWDGVLLPFETRDLPAVIQSLEKSNVSAESVTFAEAETNDGQSLIAVNDLFIGPKSHTSARYTISWKGNSEYQSSSGIIVSTGMGSTGWLQSVISGAMGVTGQSRSSGVSGAFGKSDKQLKFAVREPFPSQTTGIGIVFGDVNASSKLTLESHMPENGVIFSDGIEDDFLQFNSGCIVNVSVAKREGLLITG